MKIGESEVVLRQFLSPQTTNLHGSVFGGELYGLCDTAAYVAARKVFPDRDFVTRASSAEFIAPLFPADVIEVEATVAHMAGSSSVKVDLVARYERFAAQKRLMPSTADRIAARMSFVMVSVIEKEGGFEKAPLP